MRRAIRLERAGAWPRDEAQGTVTLAYDDRHRRRLKLASDAGEEFLLDLPRAQAMEHGDGLALAEGGFIEVKAAPEALLEVTAASPAALARIAWHIGNRHLPAQIFAAHILVREDHVVADMLRGLGADLRTLAAPFSPERGAYGGHDHAH